MLKCHLDNTAGTCVITVKGDLFTIFADLSFLIHDIYLACWRNDPITGYVFKNELRRAVDDNSSLIWEVSDTHELEKCIARDVSIRIPAAMQDLLDDLSGGEYVE